MANLRMPIVGEDFFQFVKGAPDEARDLSFFPTYAHLIAAAAALGSEVGGYDEAGEFKEKEPRPIPLEIFKSQSLYQTVLTLGIVHSGNPKICEKPDLLCRVVEGLAIAGFREMHRIYEESGPHYWIDSWAEVVMGIAQLAIQSSETT